MRFKFLETLRERLTVVYYPLWVVRYRFQERSYQVLVDAEDGSLAYGKAPGNDFFRAAMLVLTQAAALFVGTTIIQLAANFEVLLFVGAAADRGAVVGLAQVPLRRRRDRGQRRPWRGRRRRGGQDPGHPARPPAGGAPDDRRQAAGAGRMSAGYELVPLDCPSCGAAVKAEGEDVVYYCTACRNGYRFDDEAKALVPMEVAFVALANVAVELYRPFWLLPATIAMHERDAAGGGFRGLMSFFLGGGDDGASGGEGTFAVPSFHAPLPAVAALVRSYTEKLPELGERLGERLVGGRYGVGDAKKLAHYALIASEVEKPDTLKQLRYEIRFGEPRLLGVPFVRRGDKMVDAVFGIEA